jgi:hypothetical protein
MSDGDPTAPARQALVLCQVGGRVRPGIPAVNQSAQANLEAA